MVVVDTRLVEGRGAFDRRAWGDAYRCLSACRDDEALDVEDMERLAVTGYLIGSNDSRDWLHRAFEERLRLGDPVRAARCAFWLGFELLEAGEVSKGSGWLGRAHALIDDAGVDCVERGLLLIPEAIASFDNDLSAALARFVAAREIADRFEDPDLAALSRMGEGQARIAMGEFAAALQLLDDAMLMVTSDPVSPVVAGLVACGAIDACQQVLDLRRATEWTGELSRWCDAQPDMVRFRGECQIHRAEIMQTHGAWAEALAEAQRECERLADSAVFADAIYRQAELHRLRGDLGQAEDAYRRASEAGREPQPGLALLRLAQGQLDVAVGAMRRTADEKVGAAARGRILGPYVEVMVAAGELIAARAAADELAEIASRVDTEFLRAVAAHAGGIVSLAEEDNRSALPALRRAWRMWRDLDAPYEAAKSRELIGLACRAVGDTDTAAMELDAARLGYETLGAEGDAARVEGLASSDRVEQPGGLTSREVDVLVAVAHGATNREIAAALVISEHTVARHLQNMFAKLGVTSRTAAAAFAHQHDLL
jgi:DNA-binding CsgD family transcriptional regulator